MEFEYSITQTVIPFGRYKGTRIDQLPLAYLEWWNKEENMRRLKDPLLRAALSFALEQKRGKE